MVDESALTGLISLLYSRKFWLSAAALAAVVLVEALGWDEASAAQVTQAAVIIVTVLVGAIAVEDGAKKLGGDGNG